MVERSLRCMPLRMLFSDILSTADTQDAPVAVRFHYVVANGQRAGRRETSGQQCRMSGGLSADGLAKAHSRFSGKGNSKPPSRYVHHTTHTDKTLLPVPFFT